jgi:hypothetical protein
MFCVKEVVIHANKKIIVFFLFVVKKDGSFFIEKKIDLDLLFIHICFSFSFSIRIGTIQF